MPKSQILTVTICDSEDLASDSDVEREQKKAKRTKCASDRPQYDSDEDLLEDLEMSNKTEKTDPSNVEKKKKSKLPPNIEIFRLPEPIVIDSD